MQMKMPFYSARVHEAEPDDNIAATDFHLLPPVGAR